MYYATIKDCFFGQVRLSKQLEAKGIFAIDTPKNLNIVKQQARTWDNETGMNPLWEDSPVEDTIYASYGELFVRGLSPIPNLYFTDNVKSGLTAQEYDKLIFNDHRLLGRVCKGAGQWYHIDKFLSAPDALDYDYTIFRQFDTLLRLDITAEQVEFLFNDMEEKSPGIADHNHPLIFLHQAHDTDAINWQNINCSHLFLSASGFMIFNRAAVKVLRNRLFQLIMNEINFFHKQNRWSKFIIGQPCITLITMAIKQNIYPINIRQFYFAELFLNKVGIIPCIDFGRLERAYQ